jgi:hypothetical protein
MNDQTLMIATILWLRKPPRLQAIVTHFTRAVCAKRDLILLVVLGLDLLLLLHSRLTAAVEAVVVAVAAVADCLGADASAPRRERASSMRRRISRPMAERSDKITSGSQRASDYMPDRISQ